MSSSIQLIAGRRAYELIKSEGLHPSMIKAVAAAAGGPKWFTTYGLVRYIISDLLGQVDHNVHLIGASVGSWQMTAACASDPGAALDRLREGYAGHIYSDDPDGVEISEACRDFLLHMIGDDRSHILEHPQRHLHVITSRGRGWLSHENKFVLGVSFAAAAISHSIRRSAFDRYMQRTVFHNGVEIPIDQARDPLSTISYQLNEDTLIPVLRASGAIPMLMPGIRDIPGVDSGYYWDGGLTDYHIGMPLMMPERSVVLLPHFSPYVLAGWFDKKLPWIRHAPADHVQDMLLICPTPEYVASLPKGQISDMKDFYEFGERQEERIKYWMSISNQSSQMAAELHESIHSGAIRERVICYDDYIK